MKKKIKVPATKEEMEHVVREACLASARLDEVVARMSEAVALAKQPFEAEIEALRSTFAEHEELALAWAKEHPDEFATRKSVAFVHGVVGFRTGNPTLKTLKGVTWEAVLTTLRSLLPAYVRRIEEVDKAGLLAAREDIGEENLKTLGLRVTQSETAYLDVDKASVRQEAAS
jgi:phage host-nuclease inhibitor protein Gam